MAGLDDPQGMVDALARPQRNPMAPPQGVENIVNALAGGVKNFVTLPGNYIQAMMQEPKIQDQLDEGELWRREQAAQAAQNWAPEMAMMMVGAPALPGGIPRGALGSGVSDSLKARLLPAIQNLSTKEIYTNPRGTIHSDLLLNAYTKMSGGKRPMDEMMIDRAMEEALNTHDIGYYDPVSKKFLSRPIDVGDLDATELKAK